MIATSANASILNIDADDYHKRPEMSHSKLKVLVDSPRTFHAQFVAKTMEQPGNHSMEIGDMLHARLIEPERFASSFVVPPRDVLNEDGHRKGKAWTDWKKEHSDLTVLSQDEAKAIDRMAAAVESHSGASGFLKMPGQNEVKILWEYEGIPVRSMLDRLCDNWVVDIKTTRAFGRFLFAREAAKFRYFQQAGTYLAAAKALDGIDRDFALVVIENKPPYRVAIYEFDQDYLDQGRRDLAKAIAKYKECFMTNDWRDDEERETNVLSLPSYMGEVKLEGFEGEDE